MPGRKHPGKNTREKTPGKKHPGKNTREKTPGQKRKKAVVERTASG
jgi:hypothetical protein